MKFLEKIDLEDTANLESYHERFVLWCSTTDRVKEENKTAFFLTMIGKDAYNLLKDLIFPERVHDKAPEDLHKALVAHLIPVNYDLAERDKFHSIIREETEAFSHFLLRIQRQASKCNFGTQLDNNMRDRLVAGINHLETKKKLLSEKKLTFKQAKSILDDTTNLHVALGTSIASNSSIQLHQPTAAPSNTSAAHSSKEVLYTKRPPIRSHSPYRPPFHGPRSSSFYKKSSNPSRQGKCNSCGDVHSRYTCPHRNSKCFSCGKMGHLAKVCRQSRQQRITFIEGEVDAAAEGLENVVLTVDIEKERHVKHEILFEGGGRKHFIVDTQAARST